MVKGRDEERVAQPTLMIDALESSQRACEVVLRDGWCLGVAGSEPREGSAERAHDGEQRAVSLRGFAIDGAPLGGLEVYDCNEHQLDMGGGRRGKEEKRKKSLCFKWLSRAGRLVSCADASADGKPAMLQPTWQCPLSGLPALQTAAVLEGRKE